MTNKEGTRAHPVRDREQKDAEDPGIGTCMDSYIVPLKVQVILKEDSTSTLKIEQQQDRVKK